METNQQERTGHVLFLLKSMYSMRMYVYKLFIYMKSKERQFVGEEV